jgi:hypothetical protein
MSLIAKFAQLNDADLSRLSARLAQLRAEMERDLELQAINAQQPVTALQLNMASQQTGLTPQQLIEALETAQLMGMI